MTIVVRNADGNKQTANTLPMLGATSPDSSLPVTQPVFAPEVWVNGSNSMDFTGYGSVELQVCSLSGGDTITVSRAIDGANFITQSFVAADFSSGATINANGIFSFPGGGFMKWVKTGSASAPIVTVRAGF